VLELAERAGSFDAFQAGLEELAGQMDSTELVKSLALATFRARAHGDVED
jgi:hypothetical protein